jgi:hypothetical protein
MHSETQKELKKAEKIIGKSKKLKETKTMVDTLYDEVAELRLQNEVRRPRCLAVRCGAVRCGVVRCGAVRCGAVRCGAVRCGAVRCGAVRCGAVQCSAVRVAHPRGQHGMA